MAFLIPGFIFSFLMTGIVSEKFLPDLPQKDPEIITTVTPPEPPQPTSGPETNFQIFKETPCNFICYRLSKRYINKNLKVDFDSFNNIKAHLDILNPIKKHCSKNPICQGQFEFLKNTELPTSRYISNKARRKANSRVSDYFNKNISLKNSVWAALNKRNRKIRTIEHFFNFNKKFKNKHFYYTETFLRKFYIYTGEHQAKKLEKSLLKLGRIIYLSQYIHKLFHEPVIANEDGKIEIKFYKANKRAYNEDLSRKELIYELEKESYFFEQDPENHLLQRDGTLNIRTNPNVTYK